MELIKPNIDFDFAGRKTIAMLLSMALLLIGLASLLFKGGPARGIDFTGGALVRIKFAQPPTVGEIKGALHNVDLGGLVVRQVGKAGDEFLIRARSTGAEPEGLTSAITSALGTVYGADSVEVRRAEMVRPQIGKDRWAKGLWAVCYVMIGILVYVSWRFEFHYAVGAVLALAHDVLVTLGVLSLFNQEIDLPVIAAFLAIIGYSLNDTLIVYDRIRENLGKRGNDGSASIINRSIGDALSRIIPTATTSLMAVVALFIFGGESIHSFAFALLIGIVIGTYSSIFVASPLLFFWKERAGEPGTKIVATKGGIA